MASSIVYQCDRYVKKSRLLNKAEKKKELASLKQLPAKFTGYKRIILPPGPMYYQPSGRGKRGGGRKTYASPNQWSRPKKRLKKLTGLVCR